MMKYDELVERGRRRREHGEKDQWEWGDDAREVVALTPDERPRGVEGRWTAGSALRKYAEDTGQPYMTLKSQRQTAVAWSTGLRRPLVPWSVHKTLNVLEDRHKLIRDDMTVEQARAIVKSKKMKPIRHLWRVLAKWATKFMVNEEWQVLINKADVDELDAALDEIMGFREALDNLEKAILFSRSKKIKKQQQGEDQENVIQINRHRVRS